MRIALLIPLALLFSCNQEGELLRPDYCANITSWYVTFDITPEQSIYYLNQPVTPDQELVSYRWTQVYPDGTKKVWDTESTRKSMPTCWCCDVKVEVFCTNYNALGNYAKAREIGSITIFGNDCQN